MRKLHMRQSYKIIPVYTADVSGVCSALYELGGMVVILPTIRTMRFAGTIRTV